MTHNDIRVRSNITSIAIETKLYSKKKKKKSIKNRYYHEQILIRNSNKIDRDKRQCKNDERKNFET